MNGGTIRLAEGSVAKQPIVSTQGVSKRFGANAVLKNVSIAFDSNEVHAICGENGAGKTTLVKILSGIYTADEGTVILDGQVCDIRHALHAQELGIAHVSQELSLATNLSVEDNIWLGNQATPLFHRRRHLRDAARRALDTVGLVGLSLDTPVAKLGMGQRQLVEVSRMLTRDARVLILDEPTATLSDVEIEHIFQALRLLKGEGKSIIYITHRLGEVFEICDVVSVLRNGELVATRRTCDIDRQELMAMMLGRSMGELYPQWRPSHGGLALVTHHLHVPRAVHELDLVAEQGMITCLAGQLGSGAIETLRALAGLTADATGSVTAMGTSYELRSVRRARTANVHFISEDRAGEGIFLRLTVAENLVATQIGELTRFGFVMWSRLQAAVRALAIAVGVDPMRLRSRADELSGGNQQKLAFGRLLCNRKPGVILMNEPTRGVDVGARAEIYRLIRMFCDRGYAVVIASSDLEEVHGISDIIITMYRGRQVARYRREQATIHQVLADITHSSVAT